MKPQKPLEKRTFKKSFQVGRILLAFGLARTGWFADDDPDGETRRHYVVAVRVTEKANVWAVSLTLVPLYFMVAWRR